MIRKSLRQDRRRSTMRTACLGEGGLRAHGPGVVDQHIEAIKCLGDGEADPVKCSNSALTSAYEKVSC